MASGTKPILSAWIASVPPPLPKSFSKSSVSRPKMSPTKPKRCFDLNGNNHNEKGGAFCSPFLFLFHSVAGRLTLAKAARGVAHAPRSRFSVASKNGARDPDKLQSFECTVLQRHQLTIHNSIVIAGLKLWQLVGLAQFVLRQRCCRGYAHALW